MECHAECGEELIETACFLEPHTNGEMHLNVLVRGPRQYRWKKVAERLLQHHRAHASFGENVRNWAEGVVCFRAASKHKRPGQPDQAPDK